MANCWMTYATSINQKNLTALGSNVSLIQQNSLFSYKNPRLSLAEGGFMALLELRGVTKYFGGLAAEPKLLMLDEPVTGMNPTETLHMMGLIKKIRDSKNSRAARWLRNKWFSRTCEKCGIPEWKIKKYSATVFKRRRIPFSPLDNLEKKTQEVGAKD